MKERDHKRMNELNQRCHKSLDQAHIKISQFSQSTIVNGDNVPTTIKS